MALEGMPHLELKQMSHLYHNGGDVQASTSLALQDQQQGFAAFFGLFVGALPLHPEASE
jgi:hypothetical protein